jgi:fucose permease
MSIIKNPAFFLLILMCGFYYIPEHGLQNWLTTYASEHLGFTVSEGSFFTGLFYAFMTVGRLIFAVLVNKLGPKKSLFIFSVFYSSCILSVSQREKAGCIYFVRPDWEILFFGRPLSILFSFIILRNPEEKPWGL